MKTRRQGPRQQTTIARAERDGRIVCPDVLVVVKGARPGELGSAPRDDLTAWFYGSLERRFEADLESLAAAAQAKQAAPEITVDLVLRTPGGVLQLEGCRLGLPMRYAGPASTLEFRVTHPGVGKPGQLMLAA
jgi:hypothetical protein